MSGAGKPWNDRRFFYLIYRVSDATAQAGCTVLFTRHQSTKVCHACSIFWLFIEILASKVGVAKNVLVVLRKWMPRDKYLKYQHSPTHFRLPLFLGYSDEIWRKPVKSIYRINSLKVVAFPKIKYEILVHKGLQTTHATPGDYLASWNRKPIVQWDLLASITMDQDFPGKVTCIADAFFFFLILIWYLHKEKETSFLTSCLANFGLTATSLFEIWTPA